MHMTNLAIRFEFPKAKQTNSLQKATTVKKKLYAIKQIYVRVVFVCAILGYYHTPRVYFLLCVCVLSFFVCAVRLFIFRYNSAQVFLSETHTLVPY